MSPDTTFSLSVLIAIAGCFVGLAGWIYARDSKISIDAEWMGNVNAKLDMAIEFEKIMTNLNKSITVILSGQVALRIDKSSSSKN